ncbi:MAG: hypothetical protein SFY81_02770 [Verrucomicrobiota bacterium]|nr:hypothetical protein [Verrucomicrobiota bacterium]
MSKERGNPTAMVDGTELLLRIWDEQIIAARHFIMDARKRRREKAVSQVQGVHFMVLTLREQLIGIRDFRGSDKVEKHYAFFVELLEEHWKEAL